MANPNDKENTCPYEQINPHQMRREAEKHGSLGPNEQISAGHMRREAESKGSASGPHESKHEREIAKLDRGQGHEKGGR